MSLTKIQPSGLDDTKDFSSLVPSAFAAANAAYAAANAAGSSTMVVAAYDQANAATESAQAAFNKANTPSGITYTSSNTAPTSPKLGDLWYKIDQDIIFEYISDGSSNNWVDITTPTVSTQESSASLIVASAAYNQANAATISAQAAFDKANTGATPNTFVQVGFPLIDGGLVEHPNKAGLGEEQYVIIWDNREPNPSSVVFANNLITLDAGYLS